MHKEEESEGVQNYSCKLSTPYLSFAFRPFLAYLGTVCFSIEVFFKKQGVGDKF